MMLHSLATFTIAGGNYLTLLSLHRACEKLLASHPLNAPYSIPTEQCDPVQVWDILEPEGNVWRFVVYIEWLWRQRDAVRKFYTLREERGATYQYCMELFNRLYEEKNDSRVV